MQIDLHGYHPRNVVWNGVLAILVEQAWEMGERELILIHGHGRNRGITHGLVNTNTGFFGLEKEKYCGTMKNCASGSTIQLLTAAAQATPVYR
jgi:hypothetical protein